MPSDGRSRDRSGGRLFSPSRTLALGFLGLIVIGSLLLKLPFAATATPLSTVDAIFTAASAVCVTGLIVVDTPNDLSIFGQVVVLALLQLGGLGYMAVSTIVGVALGRAVSVQERLTLQEAMNVQSMEGLVRFVFTVLKLTVAFELAGALVLTLWWAGEFGLARAAYLAVFHAVSAFNNAGFSLFPDSLMRFRGDVVVNAVVMTLVICGGLGFVVLTELGRVWKQPATRLSLHARIVLSLSCGLIVLAASAFFLIERHNPATLGQLPWSEAAVAAIFQSVTTRTAGFNTIDTGAMLPASLFLAIVLMFIGAAPGGTGGGVKVSTFTVTVVALWSMVRGSTEASLFRRRLPPELVARSFSICLLGFLALNVVAGVLLLTQGREFLPTLFEATSAFGTVGLSTGEAGAPVSLAGHFSSTGKLLLAALMYMGRLGPLTLAVAIARGRTPARIRYPEGRVLVG